MSRCVMSWWKDTFFFSICDLFFLNSFFPNDSILFFHITLLWWFSHSQDSWWILCYLHSKHYRRRHFQLIFASVVALGEFRPIAITQVTAYWTQMCSGGSMFYLILRISENIIWIMLKYRQIEFWIIDTLQFYVCS